MSWDISKLAKAHRKIIISKPTCGCTEKNILAMETGIRVNRTEKIDYKFCEEEPREHQPLFERFIMLRKQPNLTSMLDQSDLVARSGTNGVVVDARSPQSTGDSKQVIYSYTANMLRGSPDNDPSLQPADRPARIGRKRTKLGWMDEERAKSRAASQNKIFEATEALVSDANSRKIAIGEGNEILIFSTRVDGENEDDEADRLEFLRFMRRRALQNIREASLVTGKCTTQPVTPNSLSTPLRVPNASAESVNVSMQIEG